MRLILVLVLALASCEQSPSETPYFMGACEVEPEFQQLNALFQEVFEASGTAECRLPAPHLRNSTIYWAECKSVSHSTLSAIFDACPNAQYSIEEISRAEFEQAELVQYLE